MKKYLFYDLEFVNLRNNGTFVCEFGYLLTDTQLNILEANQIFINPNLSDYVINTLGILRKNLKSNVNEYLSKLDFSFNYDKIIKIFNQADLIIGFGNETDAIALNNECDRYNLPFINHRFINIQKIYCYLKNNKVSSPTLKQAMINYGLETKNIKFHIAQNDAFCTYSLLNKMLIVSNMTLRKLFNRIKWLDKYSFEGKLYSVNHDIKPDYYYKFLKYLIYRASYANKKLTSFFN